MKLRHIAEENCIHCGKETVKEERNLLPDSVRYYEYREFTCGRQLRYTPNDDGNDGVVEFTVGCPLQNKKAIQELTDFTKALDVSGGFKQNIFSFLRTIKL